MYDEFSIQKAGLLRKIREKERLKDELERQDSREHEISALEKEINEYEEALKAVEARLRDNRRDRDYSR